MTHQEESNSTNQGSTTDQWWRQPNLNTMHGSIGENTVIQLGSLEIEFDHGKRFFEH